MAKQAAMIGRTILPAPQRDAPPPVVRTVASPMSKSANLFSSFVPHDVHCNVLRELNLYHGYLVGFGGLALRSILQLGQAYRDHMVGLT